MKWLKQVVVVRRAPEMRDEELAQKMAVLADHPVLAGVMEIAARLEERCLADASRANLKPEERLAGLNGYGVLQDLRVLVEKWRVAGKGEREGGA